MKPHGCSYNAGGGQWLGFNSLSDMRNPDGDGGGNLWFRRDKGSEAKESRHTCNKKDQCICKQYV